MIDYQCPHCKRMLRVSERCIGMQGACHYCGARVVIEADAPAKEPAARLTSERDAEDDPEALCGPFTIGAESFGAYDPAHGASPDEADVASADIPRAQLAQSRLEIERLARELETLRTELVTAEVAKDAAQARVRRLEAELAAARVDKADWATLRVELERTAARPVQSGYEVGRPTDERTGRDAGRDRCPAEIEPEPQAETASRDAEPLVETQTFGVTEGVPRRTDRMRLLLALGIFCVALVLLTGSLWLPPMKPVRTSILPAITEVSRKIGLPDPKARPDAPETPPVPSSGKLEATVTYFPARGQMVAQDTPAAQLAVVLVRQSLDTDAFDPPAQWTEHTTDADGKLMISDLVPGRYVLRARPEGPRESWVPLDPRATDVVAVRGGQATTCTLQVVDTVSIIRGHVADAKTGKPLGKTVLSLMGADAASAATNQKKITVTTKADGTFRVDPLEMGYGDFVLRCDAAPKGYGTTGEFAGTRKIGIAGEAIRFELRRKVQSR